MVYSASFTVKSVYILALVKKKIENPFSTQSQSLLFNLLIFIAFKFFFYSNPNQPIRLFKIPRSVSPSVIPKYFARGFRFPNRYKYIYIYFFLFVFFFFFSYRTNKFDKNEIGRNVRRTIYVIGPEQNCILCTGSHERLTWIEEDLFRRKKCCQIVYDVVFRSKV